MINTWLRWFGQLLLDAATFKPNEKVRICIKVCKLDLREWPDFLPKQLLLLLRWIDAINKLTDRKIERPYLLAKMRGHLVCQTHGLRSLEWCIKVQMDRHQNWSRFQSPNDGPNFEISWKTKFKNLGLICSQIETSDRWEWPTVPFQTLEMLGFKTPKNVQTQLFIKNYYQLIEKVDFIEVHWLDNVDIHLRPNFSTIRKIVYDRIRPEI